jgi:hypothetical protein
MKKLGIKFSWTKPLGMTLDSAMDLLFLVSFWLLQKTRIIGIFLL